VTEKQKFITHLKSKDLSERLEAARFFSKCAAPEDLPSLKIALQVERTPWILKALELAVDRANRLNIEPIIGEEDHPNLDPEIQVKALRSTIMEEISGTMLHEFSALITAIQLYASDEIPNYLHSKTNKTVSHLTSVLEAVSLLKEVSKTPTYTEFNLKDLIDESIEMLALDLSGIDQLFGGDEIFNVSADRHTLGMAFRNGLKNAVESVTTLSGKDPPSIVINWGRAGSEDYLVIIDSGSGFRIDPTKALKFGVTEKKDTHIGYGLAIAHSAIEAMEGDIQLSNAEGGGAIFELRWYSNNESITN
jgi:signal transduction histidine kinase